MHWDGQSGINHDNTTHPQVAAEEDIDPFLVPSNTNCPVADYTIPLQSTPVDNAPRDITRPILSPLRYPASYRKSEQDDTFVAEAKSKFGKRELSIDFVVSDEV